MPSNYSGSDYTKLGYKHNNYLVNDNQIVTNQALSHSFDLR